MGAVALRGPLSGGGYLAASPAGKIFVMDGRSRSVRPGTSLTAHVGGFAAVDAAGSLVATAGYSIRGGHPVLERAVKVWEGSGRVLSGACLRGEGGLSNKIN